jgi:hypothetical protein
LLTGKNFWINGMSTFAIKVDPLAVDVRVTEDEIEMTLAVAAMYPRLSNGFLGCAMLRRASDPNGG